jgi:hypothetical protein
VISVVPSKGVVRLDAEEDMFFKGQPETLYDHLSQRSRIVR